MPTLARPTALITPMVTVWFRPKGFPMANTISPTFSLVASPQGSAGSPLASILMTARSVFGSAPISFALKSRLSPSRTLISCAFSITWLFVTMYPSSETMTPDPRLCSLRSFGTSGCGNWSPKNLLKKGSSKKSKGASSRELMTRVVEIFTTEGVDTAATSDSASLNCASVSIDLDDT